jgi:hypothetical protein
VTVEDEEVVDWLEVLVEVDDVDEVDVVGVD